MKCVNCNHEQNYHHFDNGLSPCGLRECFCLEYLQPEVVERDLAFKMATRIVQSYVAKQKKCICGHDLDRHFEQMTLPIDGIKQIKTMRCITYGCGCEDFQ